MKGNPLINWWVVFWHLLSSHCSAALLKEIENKLRYINEMDP